MIEDGEDLDDQMQLAYFRQRQEQLEVEDEEDDDQNGQYLDGS